MVALAVLALGLLLWLVVSGNWTVAMMLAAFMLPVFVQAAPRWRVLFGPRTATSGGFASAADPGDGIVPGTFATARPAVDPELVQQSIAVLRDYLEQTGARIKQRPAQIEHRPAKRQAASKRPAKAAGNGRLHMSTEEALTVLGLEPNSSAQAIKEAHRRLEQRLDSEVGTGYWSPRSRGPGTFSSEDRLHSPRGARWRHHVGC